MSFQNFALHLLTHSFPSLSFSSLLSLSSLSLLSIFSLSLFSAHHLEGVCQRASVCAPGSGRGVSTALQAAGEGPVWDHRLWQHLLSTQQARPLPPILPRRSLAPIPWRIFHDMQQTTYYSLVWLHSIKLYLNSLFLGQFYKGLKAQYMSTHKKRIGPNRPLGVVLW